ncbi:MAG: glycosyltransferase [Candidatus Omnitrophota bacterium]
MAESKDNRCIKLVVFANSILFKKVISGGDVVLPRIMGYWQSNKYDLTVITTKRGEELWHEAGIHAKFILLPHTVFEDQEYIFLVPIIYIIRLIACLFVLPRLHFQLGQSFIVYTSSDFLPDVLPAFLLKRKRIYWLARIFHITKGPIRRKGNIVFNLLAYLGQKISFFFIRCRSDKIITLSGTYPALIRLGFRNKKIFISNIGIPGEMIRNCQSYAEAFEGIYIGGILGNKGTYDLIDIWSRVLDYKPRARLAIIGGATKRISEEFQNIIDKRNLNPHIKYFGYIKDSKLVYSILRAAKIYLCPGHENGFSIPVAEAMSCGIPVVAYALSMFGTAFKKGFTAVDIHDKENFARSVVSLLEDANYYRRVSQDALDESAKFKWDKIAADFELLLQYFYHESYKK